MGNIFKINIFKTIYFNFKTQSFRTALKLPVFVYRNVKIYKLGGVKIDGDKVVPGLVRLGKKVIGVSDSKSKKTVLEIHGEIKFKGKAVIGSGSKICVGCNATLTVGDGFVVTGESTFICQDSITIGDKCLFSWDILMMDSDFHSIYNAVGEVINNNRPIVIGNHVWIGCRNTILKGVTIADNNIIAAGSKITKNVLSQGNIVGNNSEILKCNIQW